MTRVAPTAPRLVAALALGLAATRAPAAHELPDAEREQLRALGYVTWTDTAERRSGVTRHEPGASPGVSYYCSEPSEIVRFIELDGRERLSLRVESGPPYAPENRCKAIEPYDADSLLVLHERTRIARVALDGRVLWQRDGPYHHDLARAADGRILALRDRKRRVRSLSRTRPILEPEVVTLSGAGEILDSVPLTPILLADPVLAAQLRKHWRRIVRHPGTLDPFHVNSIELIGAERAHAIFHPDALLIGIRNLDAVAVIDLAARRLVFRWGPGELQLPHHPSLLPNGNLLIFDNGVRRRRSRVLELDPRRGRVVWSYGEAPGQRFFSRTRGGAQALASGSVLITESERGRAFEVTRAGEIVWEFWNPDVSEDGARRATIHRMSRLEPGTLPPLAWPAPR
jgi:hypothetical protein